MLRNENNQPEINIRVARTSDDIARAVAIRAVVFMAEQNCPYEEEFDGNDLAGSTHLLAEAEGSPVATLRLRFFAEFSHLGRLAVLPNLRGLGIAKKIIESAIELCQEKGYQRLYIQAQRRLVLFWTQFGFTPMCRQTGPIIWSDHEYIEMECHLSKATNAASLDRTDPLVLLRPEGNWKAQGILEASINRGATNPTTMAI